MLLSIYGVRTVHHIVARSSARSQSRSEPCHVDLGFWYGNGPGNPAVAAQGIGYVSEFISRLTRTRITNFDTSVNGTIVSSETLFPFDQPIYVDATHDTVITAGR